MSEERYENCNGLQRYHDGWWWCSGNGKTLHQLQVLFNQWTSVNNICLRFYLKSFIGWR